jgi:hypothetical protein
MTWLRYLVVAGLWLTIIGIVVREALEAIAEEQARVRPIWLLFRSGALRRIE